MQQSTPNVPAQLKIYSPASIANQASLASDYIIPSSVYSVTVGFRPLGLSVLVFTILGSLGGSNLAVVGLCGGLGVGTIITLVNATRIGSKARAHAKAVFDKHTYLWYKATYPAHVHEIGRLSCRHCSSKKILVKNLMNRTFMRSHYCGQCGQTLYFSAENL